MKLPEQLMMRAVLFADGARGSALQIRENADLGVTCVASRSSRDSPFVTVWTLDALPDREFPTYAALCEAAESITDPAASPAGPEPQLESPPQA